MTALEHQEVVDWLKAYFSQSSHVPDDIEDQNFHELGLIDSMGIMMLVANVESHYKIQFEQSHFTDRSFFTMNGLAHMIQALHNQ